MPTPDLVSRLTVVQQITEDSRQGRFHRFRFYGGDDFFPEIRLLGKRIAFADHVLQRFSARVPNNVGEDLSNLLVTFFGAPMISLPVGPGRAFVTPVEKSLLAFTYKETDTEFFITTCLTIHEIHSMKLEVPPVAGTLHYGENYTRPAIRNWVPIQLMKTLYDAWERKNPLPAPPPHDPKRNWHRMASWIKDIVVNAGHGPGTRLRFLDQIPGPCVVELLPGQEEFQHNEIESYRAVSPECDWDAIFAERDGQPVVRAPLLDK